MKTPLKDETLGDLKKQWQHAVRNKSLLAGVCIYILSFSFCAMDCQALERQELVCALGHYETAEK